MSEDSDFNSEWKEQVETKVSMCSSLTCEDECLDGNCINGRERIVLVSYRITRLEGMMV